MAYETGSATDEHDLLDKLRTFLVAAGWTQNYWAAEGTGYRLHLSKGNVYANFRSATHEKVHTSNQGGKMKGIGFNLSTGYNASLNWSLQPGAMTTTNPAGSSTCNLLNISASVLSYYFFTNDNNFDVMAETSSDYFNSMHGGEFTQFGSFTGKLYYTSNTCAMQNNSVPTIWLCDHPVFARGNSEGYYITNVYADSKWWNGGITYGGTGNTLMHPFGAEDPSLSYRYYLSYGGHVGELLSVPPSSEGSTILLPLYFAGYQNPYNWPFGYVPGVRVCRAEYISNGKEVIIGSDTWKIFKTRSVYYAYASTAIPIAVAIKKVT